MRGTHVVPVGPSHVEFIAVVVAPGLSEIETIKRWEELGNPIFDVQEGKITAVHDLIGCEVYGQEAAEGELVWACDFCGAYSKVKKATEEHEKTCPERTR